MKKTCISFLKMDLENLIFCRIFIKYMCIKLALKESRMIGIVYISLEEKKKNVKSMPMQLKLFSLIGLAFSSNFVHKLFKIISFSGTIFGN